MIASIERRLFLLTFCFILMYTSAALNKYSAKANEPEVKDFLEYPMSLRDIDKPFRMSKLNIIWMKARNRFTDSKLKSLHSDLKIHDKEEVVYKRFKADGKDPDGLGEATLKKKLIGIMSTYGLLEYFSDTEDPKLLKRHKALNDGSNYVAKDVFKDSRLNKLWAKAELAGFTDEELNVLKEEFEHHQDKVNEYMSLLKDIEAGDSEMHENSLFDKPDSWNVLEEEEQLSNNNVPGKKLDYLGKANLLKEKHLELRNGYDRLDRLTAKGPNHKEFIEPKVQGLWRVALEAKFSPDELTSLKQELLHYESRLLKLRHLHTEAALEAARKGNSYELDNSTSQQHIKKHVRTVQKLHTELETRIMQKHTEL